MDPKKNMKLVNKIKRQESLLQSFYLISSDFKDVKEGRTKFKNRVINIVILIYIAFEMTKTAAWLFLPTDHPFSVLTGSYMMVLKRAGKLLYIAIINLSFYTFVSRLAIFIQEGKKEMDFMLLPLEFIQLQMASKARDKFLSLLKKTPSDHKHEHKYLSQFSVMYDECQLEMKAAIPMANFFVVLTCIQGSIKTGQVFSFVFGFISHLFLSTAFICGNAITSFHWKTCSCFLEMKIAKVIDRFNDVLNPANSMEPKDFEAVVLSVLKEMESYQEMLLKFDKTLKMFLFAAIASTTPITTTLIHSLIFGSSEENLLMNLMHIYLFLIFSVQGWSPCFLTAKIFSFSRVLYVKLNSIQVRHSSKLSFATQLQITKQIKGIGNEAKPMISLYSVGNEPYTPYKFFLYLKSCLSTFLLMIDMMNSSGKAALKIPRF